MSGLETAIKNALDRSDRTDREVRSRIYQSARQALDAGLQRQGVTDRLIVMQQHELLEQRIHEIEMEEVRRLSNPEPDDALGELFAMFDTPPSRQPDTAARPAAPEPVSVEPPAPRPHPTPAAPAPDMTLSGETRGSETLRGDVQAPQPRQAPMAPEVSVAPSPEPPLASETDDLVADFDESRARPGQVPQPAPKGRKAKGAKPPKAGRRAASSDTSLDVPPERAAKPRKRRSFLSHLLTWMITLVIVGGACWWFYQSGMVQSFIDDALEASDQSGLIQSAKNPDPRRGFSDEWVAVYTPSKPNQIKPGPQAKVETVSASEGQAARIISAAPGEGGDVSIEVPVDLLRNMAGKSSTVALTLQSGTNSSTQLAVRCDFGSLGSCSRHRFTATQEKLEALFRVSFDRSLAPNNPGRLIINAGMDGANRPLMLYSVRILPGQ